MCHQVDTRRRDAEIASRRHIYPTQKFSQIRINRRRTVTRRQVRFLDMAPRLTQAGQEVAQRAIVDFECSSLGGRWFGMPNKPVATQRRVALNAFGAVSNRDQQRSPNDSSVRIFGMDRYKNRDRKIAPTKSRNQRFAITRSLPHRAFLRRLMTESANCIGCDPMV